MAVVLVCSPSTVKTAKGSGKLRSSRLTRPVAPNTEAGKRRRLKEYDKVEVKQHTSNFDRALRIIQSEEMIEGISLRRYMKTG